jgi:hypothetical protein
MPIFIAKHYDGTPIDVILTASRELADAYWHGKGIVAHSVNMLSDAALEGHPTGVLPIVSTRVLESVGGPGHNHILPSNKAVIVVRRNHS